MNTEKSKTHPCSLLWIYPWWLVAWAWWISWSVSSTRTWIEATEKKIYDFYSNKLPWAKHKDLLQSYALDPDETGTSIYKFSTWKNKMNNGMTQFKRCWVIVTFWLRKTKYIWKKTNSICRLDLRKQKALKVIKKNCKSLLYW